MDFAPYVGFLAAALTTAAFFPQAIRIWRTKETDGISLPTFIVFAAGVTCWLIYGLAVRDWPIVVANALTVVPSVGIVYMTLRNRGQHRADPDRIEPSRDGASG